MKKRGLGAALAGVLLLASCGLGLDVDVEPANGSRTGDSISARERLALLKALSANTLTSEELRDFASAFLDNAGVSRSAAAQPAVSIRDGKKLPVKTERRFERLPEGRFAAENAGEDPLELWEFTLEHPAEDAPSGFVLASNDMRIGLILAVVEEGSLNDAEHPFTALFNEKLNDYIDNTIEEYNSITAPEINAAWEKWEQQNPNARSFINRFEKYNETIYEATGSYRSDFSVAVAPLIKTKWNQSTPYNNYIDYDQRKKQGAPDPDAYAYVAGCGPIAVAQLITYYGYAPASNRAPNFNLTQFQDLPYSFYKGIWTGSYDFRLMQSKVTIEKADSPALLGQVQALLYQVGKGLKSTYDKDGKTSTYPSDIAAWLRANGYKADTNDFIAATSVSNTSNSFSLTYNNGSEMLALSSLQKARPIIIRGKSNDAKKTGHIWLIDGYGMISYYGEVFYKKGTKTEVAFICNFQNYCFMVHCNLGWGGEKDGWYLYGIFDTIHRFQIPDTSRGSSGAKDYSDNVTIFVPYR